ncbi:HD domain-containing protein [Spironucleus salmonicida]|uniref:HD domain-containing protein n=1 Tax=Spironucleus salmonicida TaxID=348837 RepID=V6LMC1_9EUKA|nr:HD domain-containing protein [Spironucleus salmonicida]|eukprot:EST45780.1 HD domain-containing protein [Spironucleus salmonicida]
MNDEQYNACLNFLKSNTKCTAHDIDHSLRVLSTSVSIQQNYENSSLLIIQFAALLHDAMDHKFGFSDEDRQLTLTKFMISISINLETSQEVINIINSISYSKGAVPDSIEGKIVQDADRLDAIGAVGIARCCAYGGGCGRAIWNAEDKTCSIQHFYDKLLKIQYKMNLPETRQIAEQRTMFLQSFLDQFFDEVGGIK